MELTIAVIISIISVVITIANFVLSRKDKAVKDAKETNYDLIKYQLDELKEDVKAILNKLDKYDKDIDERINKAVDLHVQIYHGKGGE